MNYTDVILVSIIISLASLGFRVITGKGMVLYFLREPFDKMAEKRNIAESEVNRWNEFIKSRKEHLKQYDETPVENKKQFEKDIKTGEDKLNTLPNIERIDTILYIMKPVLLCSTCMASLHTLIWFPFVTGEIFTFVLPLTMLMVAFLNSILFEVYELIKYGR